MVWSQQRVKFSYALKRWRQYTVTSVFLVVVEVGVIDFLFSLFLYFQKF